MIKSRKEGLAALMDAFQAHMWRGHKFATFSLERIGLTVPQMMALTTLKIMGGRSTMFNLAAHTHQSGGTLTGVIDRLLSMGLVTRENDPQDRRVVLVVMSEAGRALLEQGTERGVVALEQVTAQMSDEEVEQLTGLLQKLSRGMDAFLSQDCRGMQKRMEEER